MGYRRQKRAGTPGDRTVAELESEILQLRKTLIEVVKKLATELEFFQYRFSDSLGVTHRYIRCGLVRCNIQRYSPLWRELPR